ncbi:MAG: type I restriction enzyme HsdR N-terminal domain-containing protein [Balneolaceae bacterium]
MLSKALLHYPQFRFRDERKLLWNPILKKVFANRPEERVRLELIDYLTLEAGFSLHRISFESPVKLPNDKTSSRTDIICYDDDFKPLLLVECKSGDIKLDEKAALQVARYNQKVGAPLVLVSNGLLDFWFGHEALGPESQGKNSFLQLEKIPKPFTSKNEIERNFQYWQGRGFTGSKSHPDTRSFVLNSCNALFTQLHQPVKFLNFDDFSPELSMAHYYRIFGLEEHIKIGISLSATPYGGTRLNVILNRQGANVAFLSSSLDLIARKEKANTEIHSEKGVMHLDLREEGNFNFEGKIADFISLFKELLIQNS